METMPKNLKTAGHGKFYCIIDSFEVLIKRPKKHIYDGRAW